MKVKYILVFIIPLLLASLFLKYGFLSSEDNSEDSLDLFFGIDVACLDRAQGKGQGHDRHPQAEDRQDRTQWAGEHIAQADRQGKRDAQQVRRPSAGSLCPEPDGLHRPHPHGPAR